MYSGGCSRSIHTYKGKKVRQPGKILHFLQQVLHKQTFLKQAQLVLQVFIQTDVVITPKPSQATATQPKSNPKQLGCGLDTIIGLNHHPTQEL